MHFSTTLYALGFAVALVPESEGVTTGDVEVMRDSKDRANSHPDEVEHLSGVDLNQADLSRCTMTFTSNCPNAAASEKVSLTSGTTALLAYTLVMARSLMLCA